MMLTMVAFLASVIVGLTLADGGVLRESLHSRRDV